MDSLRFWYALPILLYLIKLKKIACNVSSFIIIFAGMSFLI